MKPKTIKEMIEISRNYSIDEINHINNVFWEMYEKGIMDINQTINMEHCTNSLWYFTMFHKYNKRFYYKKFISEYRKYYATAREDS